MIPVRRKPDVKSDIKKIEEAADHEELYDFKPPEGNWEYVVSTGSTQLDLAISGTKIYGGGIPGSIIVEIYGPQSLGKTTILAELIASVKSKGGKEWILDPEARMDSQYMAMFGVPILKSNYSRPNEVRAIFEAIQKAEPSVPGRLNIVAADSLAAFCSAMEIDGEDKRGQARAKEFSTGLRKVATTIAEKNLLIACSNQVRQGDYGVVTPGGMGIPFYASLRIQLMSAKTAPIERTKTIKKSEEEIDPDALSGTFSEEIATYTKCKVVKSSLDKPHREATIILTHGYGVDDLRANLMYNKEVTSANRFLCTDGKDYAFINDAIAYCEDHSLEQAVKERTIKLWYKIRKELHIPRKPKAR